MASSSRSNAPRRDASPGVLVTPDRVPWRATRGGRGGLRRGRRYDRQGPSSPHHRIGEYLMFGRRGLLGGWVVALVVLTGCQNEQIGPCVPVQGKIILGELPLVGGTVTFVPLE